MTPLLASPALLQPPQGPSDEHLSDPLWPGHSRPQQSEVGQRPDVSHAKERPCYSCPWTQSSVFTSDNRTRLFLPSCLWWDRPGSPVPLLTLAFGQIPGCTCHMARKEQSQGSAWGTARVQPLCPGHGQGGRGEGLGPCCKMSSQEWGKQSRESKSGLMFLIQLCSKSTRPLHLRKQIHSPVL